jgi:predicted outer membrane repeat protein
VAYSIYYHFYHHYKGYSSNKSKFFMRGGKISGNTADTFGGGVYAGGSFIKTNEGIIYGSDETGDDEYGKPLRNTAGSGKGAAVYKDDSFYHDTTAGEGVNINTTANSLA